MPKKRTTGWEAYRYGRSDAPKPQPKPIFGKDKRRHVIDRLFDAMQDWRSSPFQFEGVTRAHIRSVLCLSGYGWERSDAEAAYLVGEALKGYQRPTWSQGQSSHTAAVTVCRGCGGPLDEYEICHGIRHCSEECRRIGQHKATGLRAGFIDMGPTKCLNPACGKVFYPSNALQQFCCHECSVIGKGLVLPERECAHCGTVFQPSNTQSQYCDRTCLRKAKDARRKEDRHAAREPTSCEHCRGIFVPKKRGAKFCSERCQKNASYYRVKAAKASAADDSHPINKLFDAA